MNDYEIEQQREDLKDLIECSRQMAGQRNQTMNPRLPTPFEEAVEIALGILIRHRQNEIDPRGQFTVPPKGGAVQKGTQEENPLNRMFDDLEQEIRNVDDDGHTSVTDALISIRDILRVLTERDR